MPDLAVIVELGLSVLNALESTPITNTVFNTVFSSVPNGHRVTVHNCPLSTTCKLQGR